MQRSALFARFNIAHAMQFYQLMRVSAGVITGIILAKSTLTTAEIGIWESLLFLGSLVIFTGVNGLLQGISPIYTPLNTTQQKKFLFQVVLLFMGIGMVLFLFFTLGKSILIPWITGLDDLPGYYWFSLYLLLNISTLPVEIIYLVQQKSTAIVGWGVVGFGGQIIAVCLPAIFGWGLEAGLIGLCLLACLKLIWTILLLIRYGKPALPDLITRKYISNATPLALNSLTGNLIALFDGWLVGYWFANSAVFAIFRYGSREFPWASALSTALGTALVPAIVRNSVSGTAELKHRQLRLLHVVMPVTILLMLLTPWLFPLVFNVSFSTAAPLFQIYLLVTMSRVLLPNSVLIGLGAARIIFRVGVLELVLKVITGWIFIHWWGLAGVGWSVVVSFWFEKLALGYYLWKKYDIAPDKWLNIKWYLFYCIGLAIAYWA